MSIKVKNLKLKIEKKTLLEDISFEVRTGEVIVILGANGAGKSTLLKALCGDLKPAEGKIFFNNRELNDWKNKDLSKIRAILPQSFELNFPFKANEVALLGRTPHINFSESERDFKIVENALKKVQATELAERFYPTLSGGEKQRIQLARVISQIWEKQANVPRYLLLDEPTAGLDLAHQHLTLQTARDFANNGSAVVAVLHDLNLAAQYATKILILRDGKVYAFDEPARVFNSELIEKVFGIEVYITKHLKDYDFPVIIPTGNFTGQRKETVII